MAAKSSKKRKAQSQALAHNGPGSGKPTKVARPLSPPDDGKAASPPEPEPEPTSLHAVTSTDELEVTVDTLRTLAAHPALIKHKQCKELRTAVHDFRQACTTGVNAADGLNLTARITGALADGKYTEARILLAEMRVRGEEPKLGALCRWVRDLDLISGLSTQPGCPSVGGERSPEDQDRLRVVDAILRTIGPVDTNPEALRSVAAGAAGAAAGTAASPAIHVQAAWDLRPPTPREPVYAAVLDKSILALAPADVHTALPVIETTPGLQRKPPNHHDAVVYTSLPHAIPLETPSPKDTIITYHPHPIVPRLGVATNVLSPAECKAIVAAGERVGFLPDAPVREDGDVSILAHNFYWVTDTAFHDALWARIAPHVPASLGGRVARGINRRFRVYRYVPGAEYRCHIDGAWPPSGVRADQTYVYDASPPDKKQSSLFTFLVYLNDDFEGGETTFFLPGAVEGTLNAYPVRPVMGAVAIFPHGETHGALLHEGTGVRKGAKYVIRTDVEYDVEPTVAG